MEFLRRMLPRTIAMQISGLVVLSLLLVFGITVGVVWLFSSEPLTMHGKVAAAVRIATVAQMVNAAESPADVASLLASARRAGMDVEQVPPSSLTIGSEGSGHPRGAAWLTRLINTDGISVLDVTVDPGKAPLVVLQVGNDNVLAFSPRQEPRSPRLFTLSVILILSTVAVFIMVLTVYAAHSITAPLSSFAVAAHSFGRDPSGDRPLEVCGPREIQQLAQALNEMRTRIRTLVDDRTRMIAAIGHDLRTPLTRLRLRAERLGEGVVQQGMIRDITSINNMLTETLSYVRDDLRTGKNLRIDLPSLLQTICSEFTDIGHDVTYHGPDRLAYWCRPGALTRALTNLIENGLKHGSKVSVSLRPTDDGIEMQVVDDGPGIAPALHEKAFEPFFKGDASRASGAGPGFGLGLSIARDVVRSHGGEIGLRNHVTQGLAVRILLPASRGELNPGEVAAEAAETGQAPVREPA